MALPTILIDSGSGSDTLASGAGPGTAVNGSAAATDGVNGKTVTITDAVDLSGVATDGSAALFINDSTAGHRNFDNITAVSGTSGNWTVTVQNGFTISLSGKSWAIGGKRASIGASTSVRLIENNAGNGDAMPGWIIELQSGHAETISATINSRRSGDTTNGPIILRGKSGAATRPILTFSNNGDAFANRGSIWTFKSFELQNSNATKTASIAFDVLATGISEIVIDDIKIADPTNKFHNAIVLSSLSFSDAVIQNCNLQNCSSTAIIATGVPTNTRITNNLIANNTGDGISDGGAGTAFFTYQIQSNIIAFNGGKGINFTATTATAENGEITGNVIHGNTSDGLLIASTSAQAGAFKGMLLIQNNRFSFNGGYGINFSGSGITDTWLAGWAFTCRNNNFYSNTSGKYNGMTVTSSINETTTDPSGGLASATKDYAGTTSGTNFMSSVDKAKGYPIGDTLAVGTGSASYNYQDMGLQHKDAGGGGTTVIVIDED